MLKAKMLTFLFTILASQYATCQQAGWRLWAEGLPQGVYPRMSVAPNHDIFYTLLGAGNNLGLVFRASTLQTFGSFYALPQIPRPSSIQNNIVALGYNRFSEPLVGIYRSELGQPWLFLWNEKNQNWEIPVTDIQPTLGAHCLATAENGIIYLGARWAYIYKSEDDGKSFKAIRESELVKSKYPCYYPSYNGSDQDGAIFGINIDHKGRVYAGTETSGVIYSDDEGISWQPADPFACMESDSTLKDTMSPLISLSMSGNVSGLGFTKEDQLVWTGADMWRLGWKNKLGYADIKNRIVSQVRGLPDYLIQTGQQVSKIVTTTNGQLFLHSGSSNGSKQNQIGIYTSWDGIQWAPFNEGIDGMNDGLSQGSLAVDGNKVFMATHDGKIWLYEDTSMVSHSIPALKPGFRLVSNAVHDELLLYSEFDHTQINCTLTDCMGHPVTHTIHKLSNKYMACDVRTLPYGLYFLHMTDKKNGAIILKFNKI